MKKKNLFKIAVVIVMAVISLQQAFGQATQNVIVGSTYHYTVTQSMASGISTYTWTNDATALQATNTPVLGAGLTNTIQVNWLAAGTYHVTALETSSNGCADPGFS